MKPGPTLSACAAVALCLSGCRGGGGAARPGAGGAATGGNGPSSGGSGGVTDAGTGGRGGGVADGGTGGGPGGGGGGGVVDAGTDGAGGGADASASGGSTGNGVLVHPGIMHTQADLERIRTNVIAKTYPWYGAFLAFEVDALSSASYVPAPVAAIGVGGYARVRGDAHAAYQNAIMWYVTRDPVYANTAIRILDGWARTCTSWICTANIDAYTSALHFAAAAEILRYAPGSGWTAAHTVTFSSFLSSIVWPVVEGTFLGLGQNGCSGTPGDGNQGAGDIRGMMAIAIFLDDRAKFTAAVNAFQGGAGTPNPCVALSKEAGGYVDLNGCSGENGRDQAHPQGGVASYSEMAQMAWCQGTDLWGLASNRILSALEWFAKYNMGDDSVPFTNNRTCYSTYGAISSIDRGQWTMTYDIAYNHYVHTKGLSMPFARQLLEERLRPEGGAIDDPGFGTLLFSLVADATPPAFQGVYKIVNLNSGKALQTVGATVGQGTQIEQFSWSGANQQQWSVIPLGGAYYRIVNSGGGTFAVDSGSAPSAVGTLVHMWTADNADNKIWKIVPDAGGGVRFVARETILMRIPVANLAWDIAAGSAADAARLQMNTASTATTSERFTLSSVATPPNPGVVLAASSAAQVTLTWAFAPTALTYQVKRAPTSGGPYAVVAGPIASTSYTNTGLASGATYYYVVSAANASGESPNSAEVIGRP